MALGSYIFKINVKEKLVIQHERKLNLMLSMTTEALDKTVFLHLLNNKE